MPEEIKNPAAAEGSDKDNKAGESSQETGDNKNTGSEGTGKEDAGTGEGEKDKGSEAPDENSKDNDEDKDDGSEPASRKRMSKQDFIIGRQKAKLAKEKAKASEENSDESDNSEGDIEETHIAPEDEALISQVVAKRFAPILDKSIQAEDDVEVNDFLSKNPDFKPFEAKARRYMAHPSRRSLPIEAIFYEVAGNKLLKIGAERQRKADAEAKATATGGGSTRATAASTKDVWSLTPAQFAEEQERIRRGR